MRNDDGLNSTFFCFLWGISNPHRVRVWGTSNVSFIFSYQDEGCGFSITPKTGGRRTKPNIMSSCVLIWCLQALSSTGRALPLAIYSCFLLQPRAGIFHVGNRFLEKSMNIPVTSAARCLSQYFYVFSFSREQRFVSHQYMSWEEHANPRDIR